MDSRRIVSLETFKLAHDPPEEVEDEVDSYDGSASEAEEDDDFLFAEDRKRKGKGKEPAKNSSRKKIRPVVEEEINDWVSSAKIAKLCDILENIRANDPTEKVIIFSQVPKFTLLTKKVYRIPGSHPTNLRRKELQNWTGMTTIFRG